MVFEITDRDLAGRIGLLKIGKKKVQTPNIFTVINPNKLIIPPKELHDKFGLNLLITNSYIIYKNTELREKVSEMGLHKFLDFPGLIMTDSGAYQLQAYGDIGVTNKEIIEFQQKIKTDVGVILDIPQAGKREKVEEAVKITLQRAMEWMDINPSGAWVGPIQGAEYLDLVEKSSKEMGKLPFEFYALGTCVPYLEKYNFAGIIDGLITAKKNLPINKPLHAFGVGLPMFFSLAVAAGADLFDSASYALYAEDGRYMTPTGTKRLEKLEYLPCSCPICTSTDAQTLRELPRKELVGKLARHNLYVIVQEIKEVKQAIHEGRLAELIENRAASHPKLLKALYHIYQNSDWLEKYDPITKRSGSLYTGSISTKRPVVIRHKKRLMSRFLPSGKVVDIKLTPLGIVPTELSGMYPFGQCEYPEEEKFNWNKQSFLKKYKLKEGKNRPSIIHELKSRAMYQFGDGAEDLLHGADVEFSKNTNRPRRIRRGEQLLATIRARDGFIVPTIEGAKLLHKFLKGMRVVVSDGEEFILQGMSAMAKFVKDSDPEIRPGDEVLVVDKEDNLLGAGKAILNREEMLAFENGIAVKVRTKFP